MLYVSLALVISGAVLVLFSLFFESEVSESRPPSDRYVPPMDEVKPAEENTGSEHEGISEELDLEIDDYLNEEMPVDEKEPGADIPGDDNAFGIVLYEDPERISVDNELEDKISPEDVSRFSRVGEGTIQVLNDGINIRIGKRLYHFDFSKIDRVYTGKSHFAMTLKGADVARVVMFENDPGLPGSIMEKLNNIINDRL